VISANHRRTRAYRTSAHVGIGGRSIITRRSIVDWVVGIIRVGIIARIVIGAVVRIAKTDAETGPAPAQAVPIAPTAAISITTAISITPAIAISTAAIAISTAAVAVPSAIA
jgi:hypothetical protein